MSGLLKVEEVAGENDAQKITVEGESLVIHTKEGASYSKIFNDLAVMSLLEEEKAIEIVKKSTTEISLPLNKRAVGLLRGCDYLSSKNYLALLSTAAIVKINKEEDSDEEELTSDINQMVVSS